MDPATRFAVLDRRPSVAVWFEPIRASSRVRSRSSSACTTDQERTRPSDRRTRSDSDLLIAGLLPSEAVEDNRIVSATRLFCLLGYRPDCCKNTT